MPPLPESRKRALDARFRYLMARRHGRLLAAVTIFFSRQSDRVVARYLGTKVEAMPVWVGRLGWLPELKETSVNDLIPPEEDRRLQIVMIPDVRDQYLQSAGLASQLIGADPPDPDDPVVQRYLQTAGERIVGIEDTTRAGVQRALSIGGERGYTPYQIAHGGRGVDEDFVPIREVIAGEPLGRGMAPTPARRADTIVRTELAYASAQGTLDSYDASDIDEVEVSDGDSEQWGPCGWTDHDDPDVADGSRRTMEEANDYPIAHPNCVRVFYPVFQ